MTFIQNVDYWASASCNEKFICLETLSGLGRVRQDFTVPSIFLSLSSSEETVGESTLIALSKSRTLKLDEYAVFFNHQDMDKEYNLWVAKTIEKFEFASRKALFKNMKSCSLHCINGMITIRPSRHVKLEAWSGDGITESDYVRTPADSSPAEIGAALRLAFSRCIG
ncbi:contact-dependent growth inhibition system immunity protein [Sodalis sp. RH19]|uniref:contact-dependent growth inhibition system immunity protein n=1 Tax=Sodalis sp. RH19 TaxID=3394334 RepID=UPI0039B41C7B